MIGEIIMKKSYRLKNLDCANCALKMENEIKKIDGVTNASVSFMTQRMTIETEDGKSLEDIMKTVVEICKKVEPDCTILL